MRKCVGCGRKGLFLKLDKRTGLCKRCLLERIKENEGVVEKDDMQQFPPTQNTIELIGNQNSQGEELYSTYQDSNAKSINENAIKPGACDTQYRHEPPLGIQALKKESNETLMPKQEMKSAQAHSLQFTESPTTDKTMSVANCGKQAMTKQQTHEVIQESRDYYIGKACSFGFYLIVSKPDSVDAIFNQYPSMADTGWYHSTRCHFGCVEVKPPNQRLRIENGKAYFIGEEKFDLYEIICKANLPDRQYFHEGVDVYKSYICKIRVFFRDRCSTLFFGDRLADINDQFIFSINSRYYLCFSLDVRSFRNYSGLQVCLRYKDSNKTIVYGKDGFSLRSINYIEFSDEGKDLLLCRINDHDYYFLEFPKGVNPSQFTIAWIRLNRHLLKPLLTDKAVSELYTGEFHALKMVLMKYQSLGFEIDIENELSLMEQAPDFAPFCSVFLEKELTNYYRIRNKLPQKESRYTFHVGAAFNKKYYCATKLAEKAVDVQVNSEGTVYYITFDGTQIEEISLMYFNLLTPFNQDAEYMTEAFAYLKQFDFSTYLESAINAELGSLREEYGYSRFANNSVLVHIIKGINAVKRRSLTALYTEMIKEKRVATKWSSEYRLYSIIKRLVPEAVYQYRTEWLGAQSFDIFLPDQRIAIEYQGQQHYQPVEVFGGQNSYQDNKTRDARKRQLAAAHGVLVLDSHKMHRLHCVLHQCHGDSP